LPKSLSNQSILIPSICWTIGFVGKVVLDDDILMSGTQLSG